MVLADFGVADNYGRLVTDDPKGAKKFRFEKVEFDDGFEDRLEEPVAAQDGRLSKVKARKPGSSGKPRH